MEPTREKNIIDLFCTNKPGLVKSCQTIPCLSDHECVLADCDVKAQLAKKAHRKKSSNGSWWTGITLNLLQIILKVFLSSFHNNAMDQNYTGLRDHLESTIDRHVPSNISKSKSSSPWFSAHLKQMCKKRQSLFSGPKHTRKPSHWECYKAHKGTLSKKSGEQDGHILMAFWTFASLIITLKPFWRYIRSQWKDNLRVAALKEDGRLFSDGTKEADILSRQFASVFTRGSVRTQARLYGPNYPAIKPLTIDQCRVEKQLQGQNVGKASGPNNQPCRLLRVLAHELAPLLTRIDKQSIETSHLPSIWTKAFVALVFQKGARCMPENYRPVSLTCVSCKILEPIICKHFITHLEQYGILTPLNHGFCAKFSRETQLLLTLQDLLLARDRKIQTDVAISDF